MVDYGRAILNGKAISLLVMVVVVFTLTPIIDKCSEMPGSQNLQFGQRVMFQMTGRENLRQVNFFKDYPDGKPSDFVEMVSDPEHLLWPPPPAPAPEEFGIPQPSSNRILMPPNVVFSDRERQSPDSDEIVYVPDDTNRKIVIRGYTAGVSEVTFEYEWDFPTKAGKVPLD